MRENSRELAELRERLERLERALRRWRLGAAMILPLAVVAVISGASADGPVEELRAQTLRIVDREGKDRMILTADTKAADMTFLDPAGKSRLTLDIADDHRPVLQFAEAGGEKSRLTLGIEDGTPMLQIYDRTGKKRVAFGVPREGGPVLRILDENERTRTRFP